MKPFIYLRERGGKFYVIIDDEMVDKKRHSGEVVFKMDFEKTCNLVEWDFLDQGRGLALNKACG